MFSSIGGSFAERAPNFADHPARHRLNFTSCRKRCTSGMADGKDNAGVNT
jgi:hypothetical protein